MFGISALKTSIPSVLRRPKICSVLRDFICEKELNRKYAVSIKYWVVEARKHWLICQVILRVGSRLGSSHVSDEVLPPLYSCVTKRWACSQATVGYTCCTSPPLLCSMLSFYQSQSNKIVLGFVFNLPGISNTQDSVRPHFKHLEVLHNYSTASCIFISLLSVWNCLLHPFTSVDIQATYSSTITGQTLVKWVLIIFPGKEPSFTWKPLAGCCNIG